MRKGLSHRGDSPGVLHRRRTGHALPAADGPARGGLAVDDAALEARLFSRAAPVLHATGNGHRIIARPRKADAIPEIHPIREDPRS